MRFTDITIPAYIKALLYFGREIFERVVSRKKGYPSNRS
jgi:hypothetical protein